MTPPHIFFLVFVMVRLCWAHAAEPFAPGPLPGDVFREYSWTTEKFHVFSLKTNLFALPAEVDLKDATRAEVVVELANQHMGFEGMVIRLNSKQWYPIRFPASSPQDPSRSLWFHHWYPTIPIALTDLKEGTENTLEMKVPAECFDGRVHPNGKVTKEHPEGEWGWLPPWCPLYGLTVRVYYDPARKPHPTGKVLTPASQSTLGLSIDLTASAGSDNGAIRQIDFVGRYQDINYEGDGIYDQWHGHLFHGKITRHLGSTTQPDGKVTWDTSWVPDQPSPMEIAARITDSTGLIYMTEAVGGLKLVRPGLSVELCKPFDVPRSFTGCQYGEWVISGVRTQKFTVKGDLSKAVDARYVIASWGNQKECPGYTINGVPLEDKPAGADYYYNLSTPPIRSLTALKAGENTFSTVVAKGRMPDIYMPGVQILIRYRRGDAGAPSGQSARTPQAAKPVGQSATSPGVLLPGDKPTRIDVGATQDYTAADGTVWLADRGFNNGRTVDRGDIAVNGAKDPALFRTERNGMVDYTFAIPNGVYTVNLHLAETDPAVTNAGQRLFNVDINGWPMSSVDIFGEGKSNKVAKVKSALVEVTNRILTVRFMQRKLSAKLDALEIIPEPRKTAPPKPAPRVISRRLPANTLPPTKHFVLEDFENTTDADLHKKWNQWGQLTYQLDAENKSGGQSGVTHQVGKVNTSWFGYPPRLPVFSCAGMNAWRMWVKPDGSGRFATFFIKDGSQEVYCWCLPDLLVGTEPYILEVPFANYSYIFRENNQVFEPEDCAEFGYWVTGPCTFSLDDIMLVHDPDLPDFLKTSSPTKSGPGNPAKPAPASASISPGLLSGAQVLIQYRNGKSNTSQSELSSFLSPAVQKVRDHLQNISAVANEELARDIVALAPEGLLKADDKDLAKFIQDMVQGLSGKTLSADHAAALAGDLEETLNPGQGSVRQTQGAVRNFAHMLKVRGVDHAQADLVGADLTVLAKVPADPGPPDAPAHEFRYALAEAPKYDKAVLVEDFESGTDIFKTWYQPYWSTGIVATFDSEHRSGGNRGLTISNTGPASKRSSMAKVPRPSQNLAGCNALRLWFKPYGMNNSEGAVSMGFIDGSDEIWQVDLPEVLSGAEPCILQVRLADFRRVLRRNNTKIDLENRDFCFWMTGTYKFTMDDIMFVHDPAVPDFPQSPSAAQSFNPAISEKPSAQQGVKDTQLTQATNAVDVYDYLEVTVRPEKAVRGNPVTDVAIEGEFTFLKDEWTTETNGQPSKTLSP